jgi:cytochrome d ubiquinol oxidase subunit II
MDLAEAPLLLMLLGLTAYTVLGGADFGAGFWSLPGLGRRGSELRDHAHHAMGPVWETNHVWLTFVLVLCWTAYPRAFGSIMSTLAIPLFLAGLGIILRGATYALRAGTAGARELKAVDAVFALASVLTPFALGAAIGGVASGRVPVGNAEGDAIESWLNPTSIVTGLIAVAAAAYLAAVYLAADAARMRREELVEAFRRRALVAAAGAGLLAAGGLAVVRSDVPSLWDGLTSGAGLLAVITSACAGVVTIGWVWRRRFALARIAASVAVAAVVGGWALAQRPDFLAGLTIEEAAAGRSTLIAALVAAAIGAVVLVPSLVLLYGMLLRGRFDGEPAPQLAPSGAAREGSRSRLLAAAGSLFGLGAFLTFFFEGPVLAIGVALLFGFLVCGFVALADPGDGEEPENARRFP